MFAKKVSSLVNDNNLLMGKRKFIFFFFYLMGIKISFAIEILVWFYQNLT